MQTPEDYKYICRKKPLIKIDQEQCNQFSSRKRAVDYRKLEEIKTNKKHGTFKTKCYRGMEIFTCYTNVLVSE